MRSVTGRGTCLVFLVYEWRDEVVRRLAGTELVVRARRMDGPGRWRDTFAAIGYEGQHGVPSYASSIALPRSGCWRLTLTTGKLTASVDMFARRQWWRSKSSGAARDW
jgi:hypothetical protein